MSIRKRQHEMDLLLRSATDMAIEDTADEETRNEEEEEKTPMLPTKELPTLSASAVSHEIDTDWVVVESAPSMSIVVTPCIDVDPIPNAAATEAAATAIWTTLYEKVITEVAVATAAMKTAPPLSITTTTAVPTGTITAPVTPSDGSDNYSDEEFSPDESELFPRVSISEFKVKNMKTRALHHTFARILGGGKWPAPRNARFRRI